MFSKSSLIVVTLALIAQASPVEQEPGTAIPLQKRGELTQEDGTFNFAMAAKHMERTHNKHRQNLMNLERNAGREAFPEGAEIRPPVNASHFMHHDGLEKRQNEALTDQSNDLEWTGPVSIGTPAQVFTIDFDTGSSDLWIPSTACTSSTCTAKHRFNIAKSTSAKKQSGSFSIQYGDGSTVSGPVYTDNVLVAGIPSKTQYFSPVTTLSSSFAGDPEDGILGLAYQSISNLGKPPFFLSAVTQKAVPQSVFGFKLAKTGSELYLGGTNANLYTGAIEYHAVSKQAYWQLGGASAMVNGKTPVTGFQTIIDSGTTIMYGPPSAVASFYAAVPGSKALSGGMYSFPCKSVPTVGFSWGGKTWAISSANFNLGLTASGSTQCVGALVGQDLGLGNGVWLLGDSFMKNQYNVFNVGTNSVGFATLK